MSKRGPEQQLGQALVDAMRSQSDQRIRRNVKEVEIGTVISLDPLRVAPQTAATSRIIYDAADIGVLQYSQFEQGQTVMIIRSRTDELAVLPLVPGYDLQEPPQFSGTDGPAGSNPTYAAEAISASGPAGDRVIAKALSYLGTKETGENTDNGGPIDRWITEHGLSPGPDAPWCGMFADSMYKEAGVDDQGFGDPYTGDIVTRARAAGRVLAQPVKGCFAVKGTQHVTLYIEGPIASATCVGGNQSDAVTKVTYNLTGWFFCVPKALTEDPPEDSPPNEDASNSGAASNRPPMGEPDWE